MDGRLSGRTAVVTGAASGLGRATVDRLAAEGARVIGLDIAPLPWAGFDRSRGAPRMLQCDVADASSVAAAVNPLDRVDILVNCAGVAMRRPGPWDPSQDGPAADLDEAVFDRTIAVNLKSQFLMCRAVLPRMTGSGGSIINVSSIGGAVMGSTNTAYCTSKAGVVGLTRSIAFSYGRQGIRANAVCPGAVRTPMAEYITEDDDYRTDYESAHPLGRIAETHELAAVIAFLASDDASYVNGAVITADGGWTIRAR